MSRLRRSIEDYFLRNATELVDGMASTQGELLAEALEELEQRSAAVAVAEARADELERRLARFGPSHADEKTQVDHLLAELEDRDGELAKLRRKVEELTIKLASATADVDARERSLTDHVRRADAQEKWVKELEQRAADAEAAREEAVRALRARETDDLKLENTATEVTAKAAELGRREADVARREAAVAGIEVTEARTAELEDRIARLRERERRLADREAELANVETMAASEKARAERQNRRIAELEQELRDRARELDEREAAFDTRTARLEADLEIREQRLERAETELAELRERLAQKESELATYVAQVQRLVASRPRFAPAFSEDEAA